MLNTTINKIQNFSSTVIVLCFFIFLLQSNSNKVSSFNKLEVNGMDWGDKLYFERALC